MLLFNFQTKGPVITTLKATTQTTLSVTSEKTTPDSSEIGRLLCENTMVY